MNPFTTREHRESRSRIEARLAFVATPSPVVEAQKRHLQERIDRYCAPRIATLPMPQLRLANNGPLAHRILLTFASRIA